MQIPIEYSFFQGRGISVEMTDYVKENFINLALIYVAAKLLISVPYFVLAESSRWQATIGKKIFGLQVGDFEGKRISVSKAEIRFFGKILSGQVLLIGYFMAFFTRKKQAFHDLAAKTIVFEK